MMAAAATAASSSSSSSSSSASSCCCCEDDDEEETKSSCQPRFRSLTPIPEYEYLTSGEADDEGEESDLCLSQASHSDLAFEWSMLCQNCIDCWSGTGELSYFCITRAERREKIDKEIWVLACVCMCACVRACMCLRKR